MSEDQNLALAPNIENSMKTSPFNLVEYLNEDKVNIKAFIHLKIS